jgi:hypothetical protein
MGACLPQLRRLPTVRDGRLAVRTWMDVYRRNVRRRRQLRFLMQKMANRAAWSAAVEIVDLGDPNGKRFLFEVPLKTAK